MDGMAPRQRPRRRKKKWRASINQKLFIATREGSNECRLQQTHTITCKLFGMTDNTIVHAGWLGEARRGILQMYCALCFYVPLSLREPVSSESETVGSHNTGQLVMNCNECSCSDSTATTGAMVFCKKVVCSCFKHVRRSLLDNNAPLFFSRFPDKVTPSLDSCSVFPDASHLF